MTGQQVTCGRDRRGLNAVDIRRWLQRANFETTYRQLVEQGRHLFMANQHPER